MKRIGFALAALAALSISAQAQEVAPVSWAERQPTAADFNNTYPVAALAAGVDGAVQLLCTLQDDRTLDCGIQSESPEGMGFGDAALRLSKLYVVRPDMGLTAGARVILPIRYVVQE